MIVSAEKIQIPDHIIKSAQKSSETHGVPKENILAMILVENPEFKENLKHTNTNGSVDYGISQINSCNLKEFKSLGYTDIFNVDQNIQYGTLKLKWAYDKYQNWEQAYMVYNMGDGGASRLFKKGIYSSKYSRKVMDKLYNINQYIPEKYQSDDLDQVIIQENTPIDSILFEDYKINKTLEETLESPLFHIDK